MWDASLFRCNKKSIAVWVFYEWYRHLWVTLIAVLVVLRLSRLTYGLEDAGSIPTSTRRYAKSTTLLVTRWQLTECRRKITWVGSFLKCKNLSQSKFYWSSHLQSWVWQKVGGWIDTVNRFQSKWKAFLRRCCSFTRNNNNNNDSGNNNSSNNNSDINFNNNSHSNNGRYIEKKGKKSKELVEKIGSHYV